MLPLHRRGGGSIYISVRAHIEYDYINIIPDLQVNTLDSIASVKDMLRDKLEIPCRDQCLVFRAKILEDDRSLDDYNIKNGSTLHLIIRQGRNRSSPPDPEQQRLCLSNFRRKAVAIVIAQALIAYGAYSSASSSTWGAIIKYFIPIAAFVIIHIAFSVVTEPPKWASAVQVYFSGSLLVTIASVLFLSFNKDYGFALFFVPLPIVPAALGKICKIGRINGTADQDLDVQEFDSTFDFASDIVIWFNCAGIAAMIFGLNNLAGPVTLVGLFSFFTQVLGIYLMVITTVRTPALTPHARYLVKLLSLLCGITVMTPIVTAMKKHARSSGRDSHA